MSADVQGLGKVRARRGASYANTSMHETTSASRAVLVGIQFPGVSDAEHESSLDELERLATTLGLEVVGRLSQRRAGLAPAAVLGEGRLDDLKAMVGTAPEKKDPQEDEEYKKTVTNKEARKKRRLEYKEDKPPTVDVVLVDHEISPSQTRNLEKVTGAEVMDRAAVIVSIFHRHARTREAKLQVEIARLRVLAPKLREVRADVERQRGGIGGKGAGESAVELDKRKIRDRIAELKDELIALEKESGVRKRNRAEHPTVALVGYTNAGKSSWMRALTTTDAYIADKLFATLDTTIRALIPETRPRTLVSDTVGFIKKLPHDLVASFRSTLEEARDAHMLLHVVDASDAAFRSQMEVTRTVLSEIGVTTNEDRTELLLLNKIDRVSDDQQALLKREFPDALLVSSRDAADISRVHETIVSHFHDQMIETELTIPFSAQRFVARAHEQTNVLEERHDETGTTLRVRGVKEIVNALIQDVDGANPAQGKKRGRSA